jgi:co-chaperonin GroES (HSP10)
MDGSKLARGERTAAFNVEGSEEFMHDLKTLTKPQFLERYECNEEGYSELITALQAGTTMPGWIATMQRRITKLATEMVPMELAKHRSDIKVTITTPEKISYKADCRGDNVLVIRVEREHSSQLIIPDSAKAKSDIGHVAEVGPQATRCKKGELVLFDRFAAHGKEIELVDEQGIPRQHLLLNDVDVLLGLRRSVPVPDEASPSESEQ